MKEEWKKLVKGLSGELGEMLLGVVQITILHLIAEIPLYREKDGELKFSVDLWRWRIPINERTASHFKETQLSYL